MEIGPRGASAIVQDWTRLVVIGEETRGPRSNAVCFTWVLENRVQLWSLVYRVKGPLCPRQEESAARFAVFLRFGAFCLRSSLLEEFFLV